MLPYIYNTLFIVISFLVFYRLILGRYPKTSEVVIYSIGYFSLILIMFIQFLFRQETESNIIIEIYRLIITFLMSFGSIISYYVPELKSKDNDEKQNNKLYLTFNAKMISYIILFILSLQLVLILIFFVNQTETLLLVVTIGVTFLLLILNIVTIINKISNQVKGDAIIIVNRLGYSIINISNKWFYNTNNLFDFYSLDIPKEYTGTYILKEGYSLAIKVYVVSYYDLEKEFDYNEELHNILYNWQSRFIRLKDI